MARIRTVKPEFFKHLKLFKLEQETQLPIRLSYAGLWTCCDREGRFKWIPEQLKIDVLPYDVLDFSRVLDALLTRGFIRKYRVDCEDYGYIPSWKEHQFINNKEVQSVIPEPQEAFEIQPVDASNTRGDRVVHVISTCGGKEGKGKEGKDTTPPTPSKEGDQVHVQRKSRRKKTDPADLSGYAHPEEIKQLRDHLFPKWPTERTDGTKVDRSEVKFAERVDDLLNQGWSLDTLMRSADLYLREKPSYPACTHNFFGPGNGNLGNFKAYAKMIYHNDKANGNGAQPRLPEVGNRTPEDSARAAGVGR